MSDAVTDLDATAASRWRLIALVSAAVFVVLLLLFRSTAGGMVHIWYNFETYTHGFIILPISLWLIWQKRAHLAMFTPQPALPFLVFVIGSLFVWGIAYLSGVQVVEQFAFVGVVVFALATLLGWQVAKFLAFPLLFLFFAVPMGEDLVEPMMQFTADFTVGALKLTGIPVYRDGLWFSLPTGNWSVVEACSGVRYLIASVTLGVMYAYVTYHTLWKRLVFIAMSAIVPIIANGVRAYMIVMIGHLSDMKYATGVDHLIYGWFFFGVVMFILFWIGSFWQEHEPPPTFVVPRRNMTSQAVGNRVMGAAVVIALLSAATVWAVDRRADATIEMAAPLQPPSAGATWRLDDQGPLWNAARQNTGHVVDAVYQSEFGVVQLYVSLYPHQRQGEEAINAANRVADELTRYAGLGSKRVSLGARDVLVNQARAIVPVDGIDHRHLVWQWYRIAGRELINRYEGKAWEAVSRIWPGRADGVWIAITTPTDAASPEAAQRRLASFASEMIPAINAAIDTALGVSD